MKEAFLVLKMSQGYLRNIGKMAEMLYQFCMRKEKLLSFEPIAQDAINGYDI